jgi:predicted MFS family arabinose efflux permease
MSQSRDESLWRLPGVRRLLLVSFLGFASFCLTLASLPTWAVQGGASQATAGLVTTVMLVATVAVQGVVPAAITRLGIGPALALGLLLLGAPSPLYGLSSQLPLLLSVSAIRGVGFALLTVIGATLTGIVAPPSRHGEAVGVYGLSIALPNLIGVPAGVALTIAGHFPLVGIMAASPLLAVPLALRMGGRPDRSEPAEVRVPGVRRTAAVLTVAPSLVLLVVTAAGGGLVTFLPIERPNGTLATLGLLVFGAAAAVARWRAGLLVDRMGSRILLPASLVLSAVGLGAVAGCLLGGSSYDALLLVGALLFGLGYGAVQNLSLVLAFARAGPEGGPIASAVWNAAFDTGTAAGAVGVGVLAHSGLGLPWSFAVTAAFILVMLPVAFGVGPTRRRAG